MSPQRSAAVILAALTLLWGYASAGSGQTATGAGQQVAGADQSALGADRPTVARGRLA